MLPFGILSTTALSVKFGWRLTLNQGNVSNSFSKSGHNYLLLKRLPLYEHNGHGHRIANQLHDDKERIRLVG